MTESIVLSEGQLKATQLAVAYQYGKQIVINDNPTLTKDLLDALHILHNRPHAAGTTPAA